jgi:hypothetical protein
MLKGALKNAQKEIAIVMLPIKRNSTHQKKDTVGNSADRLFLILIKKNNAATTKWLQQWPDVHSPLLFGTSMCDRIMIHNAGCVEPIWFNTALALMVWRRVESLAEAPCHLELLKFLKLLYRTE